MKILLYLIIGVVSLLIEQITVNIIFHQRWHFMWKGFKTYLDMCRTMFGKVMFMVACIVVLMFDTLIWPITLIWDICRTYAQRERIKDSIEIMKELES